MLAPEPRLPMSFSLVAFSFLFFLTLLRISPMFSLPGSIRTFLRVINLLSCGREGKATSATDPKRSADEFA